MANITYNNYEIIPHSDGFQLLPNALVRVASFIVQKEDVTAAFAFTDGGVLLHMSDPSITDTKLNDDVIGIIHSFIDDDKINHTDEYTFEYHPTNYIQVSNPRWWTNTLKEIYGK
jgi:hypothetical protein